MSEFWSSVIVKKARKQHRCEYCGAVIEIGTSYSRESGNFEGEMQDYALCLRCRKLLDSNDQTWAFDEELGNFHDAFMDSKFIKCEKCGSSWVGDIIYKDDMTSVAITCDKCDAVYVVDLSCENLLSTHTKDGNDGT